MSSGSSARLIARMAASAGSPCSAAIYFILPWPMPCSPVQVPSIAERALDQPFEQSLGARDLVGIVGSTVSAVEIAVADMADDRRDEAGSRRRRAGSRVTHSASREIGTQTSVDSACVPGRRRRAAQ